MQVTLYEAAATVRELLEQIDPETGELPEGYEQARAIVATKAQAVAAFVLENEHQADMVEAHAKALLARVKTARKRSEWLREYLRSHMTACGVLSIKAEDGTFSAVLSPGRDESVEEGVCVHGCEGVRFVRWERAQSTSSCSICSRDLPFVSPAMVRSR